MKKLGRLILSTTVLTLLSFSFGHSFTEVHATSINISDTSESSIRSYYSSLNSLSTTERQGTNLLENLKPIISQNHSVLSYDATTGTWAWFKITDRDWTLSPMTSYELANYTVNKDAAYDDPYVRLLYRNDNGTATAAKYSDTHGTYIDREHVWPQSHGFKATSGATGPAGTDLHHLMLADSVNNQQGHSNYDWGVPTTVDAYIGTAANHNNTGKRGTLTYGGTTATVYEPQDSDKGNIARACFYMVARYASYTSAFDPYLTLIDGLSGIITQTSSEGVPATLGILSTLLEWNALDPVDDYEVHRNNLIYNNVQNNRNPFIDYPSWADAVWGTGVATPSTDDVRLYGQSISAPTALSLSPSSATVHVGNEQTLSVTPTPSSASSSVTWSTSNASIASVSNGLVTGVAEGSATITATSTVDTNITATATITVTTLPTRTLSSISLSGSLSTATLCSTYSTSGMTVTAQYSNLETADVTSTSVINTPNTSVLGTQSVRVSYTEGAVTQDAYYSVKVTNQGANIGIGTPTYATDLIISQYIEGSSNNKALELYNGTGVSQDLSTYKISIYSNGSATATGNIPLTGNLPHGSTFVICHTSANATIMGLSNQTSGSFNFNGNDGVALIKGTTTIDVFGQIGVDPGTSWGSGLFATADHTLIRKPAILSGDTNGSDSFDPAIQWDGYATDTTTDLGSHTMNISPNPYDASPTEQASAFVNYVLDGIGADASGSCGAVFTELKAEHDYMDTAAIALFDTSTDELFVSARERYNYMAAYTGNSGSAISGISNLSIETSDALLLGILFISVVGLSTVLIFATTKRKEQ